jgi:acetylornithine deacetylase/succinyl-diaminopimelate desuccinylase-like protein
VPVIDVATRGLAYFHVIVRTGERDLHSGLYGGAALNATHALIAVLDAVRPRDGRVPEPLRTGVVPPSAQELADWASLQPGAVALAEQGARPADSRAAEDFYRRTWAEPAVDVHGVAGGSPQLQKTVIPARAEANLSIRLVPAQTVEAVVPEVERLLHEAAPAGADVEVELWSSTQPGVVPAASPAIPLAQRAFERVVGKRPLLTRSGGSLPIVPALAGSGIPTIVTGFAPPSANVHSPDERLAVEDLEIAISTAKELYRAFAALR